MFLTLIAVFAVVVNNSKSFLVNKVISASRCGYLMVETLVSMIVYTAIAHKMDALHKVKDTSKDWNLLIKISSYIEVPRFVSKFCVLKLFQNKVALASTILSSSPLINLVQEKFEPKLDYILNKRNSCDVSLLNKFDIIVKNHPKSTMTKDDIFVLMYIAASALIFLDSQDITDNNFSLTEVIGLSTFASLSLASSRYYTKKYVADVEPTVFTALSLLCSLPVQLFSYAALCFFSQINIEKDTESIFQNFGGIICFSIMHLLSGFSTSYAIKNIKYVSDFGIITAITANTFALFLDKEFDLFKLTFYSTTALILEATSLFGIMMNSRSNSEETFLMTLLRSQYDDESFDYKQIEKDVKSEFKTNAHFYSSVVKNQNQIDTVNYSVLMLVVYSKMFGNSFKIMDKDNNVKLIVRNGGFDQRTLDIKLDIEESKDFLFNKIVSLYPDKLDIENIEIPLVGFIDDNH